MKPHAQTGRHWRDQGGWTLIELMIAMAMLLLILAAALPVITSSQHTEADVSTRADKIQKARVLAEQLGRDLRSAYRVVTPVTATDLTFETYLRRTACDTGGLSSPSAAPIPCRIVYSCSGGTCTRTERNPGAGSGGTVRTMVTGLSDNNLFSYTPSASSPTFVGIQIIFPSKVGDDAVTLEDGVALRNITP